MGPRRLCGRLFRGIGDRRVAEEAECGAAAAITLDLDEGQIFPAGQEPDPFGGDGLVADGAGRSVQERAQLVAGIHPRGV